MRAVVGRIGRPQGVRGEVTVQVHTDSPEKRFAEGAVLVPVGRPGLPVQLRVRSHRWQGGRLVLMLEGVEDRTAAEVLRGVGLEAEVDLTDVADDEYHDLALLGLAVRDRSGRALGRIREVLHLPGQDVLAVAKADGGEVLVPFVRELVPEVDVPAGHVVVDLPEGLGE
jgi:16S rRNA processing protein RimM